MLLAWEGITLETAKRALLYRGLLPKIAQVCRCDSSQVWRVLKGEVRSGEVRERVIPVAVEIVTRFEEEHGIGPERRNRVVTGRHGGEGA